ncbi:signal peptidase I [Salinithrix halophila]|uniref:Signal peptidase I n=1 Tax=Salinithrix halophila TaxID=1485204 RepID=A0ABV8JAI0_9BACL
MSIPWKRIIIWATSLSVLLVLNIMLFFQFFGFYRVYGNSMAPALKHDEIVTSLKWSKNPEVGEIVLFHHEEMDYIKRTVALEGDTVEGKNGSLYINGKPAKEPYLEKKEKMDSFGPIRVPKGSIFVLGDDREESYDSRDMGPIPKKDIQGVLFRQ